MRARLHGFRKGHPVVLWVLAEIVDFLVQ